MLLYLEENMNTTFSCDFARTRGLGHVEQISGGCGGRELWPTGWWNLLDILEGFQVLPGLPGESLSETGETLKQDKRHNNNGTMERDMGQGCEMKPGGGLVSILSKPSRFWPSDPQRTGFGISQSSPTVGSGHQGLCVFSLVHGESWLTMGRCDSAWHSFLWVPNGICFAARHHCCKEMVNIYIYIHIWINRHNPLRHSQANMPKLRTLHFFFGYDTPFYIKYALRNPYMNISDTYSLKICTYVFRLLQCVHICSERWTDPQNFLRHAASGQRQWERQHLHRSCVTVQWSTCQSCLDALTLGSQHGQRNHPVSMPQSFLTIVSCCNTMLNYLHENRGSATRVESKWELYFHRGLGHPRNDPRHFGSPAPDPPWSTKDQWLAASRGCLRVGSERHQMRSQHPGRCGLWGLGDQPEISLTGYPCHRYVDMMFI